MLERVHACACACDHSTSVGAQDPLRVFAQLFALPFGEVALLPVLADISGPAIVALARPAVTVAAVLAENTPHAVCQRRNADPLPGLRSPFITPCDSLKCYP